MMRRRRRQAAASLARGPSARAGEPGDSPRALRALLEERTAQLELAVGAGRRLQRQRDAEVSELQKDLAAVRERLAELERELESARAAPVEGSRQRLLSRIRRG